MKIFRFKSLQSRLLFFFLSLFSMVGFFALFTTNTLHDKIARELIETELGFSAKVVDALVSAKLEAHRQAAWPLSKDYAFQEAFSTKHMDTVSSAMDSLKFRTNADLIMLLSIEDDHKILVELPKSKLTGESFLYPDLIAQAEDTGEPLSSFISLNEQLYSIIIVPALAPDPLFWFCIGFRVDKKFLNELQKIIPSDLSLVEMRNQSPTYIRASTLPEKEWSIFSATLPKGEFNKGISVIQVGTERFLIQARKLDEKAGTWLMIQHSLEKALQPLYSVQKILLAIGIIGIIITFLGSAAIARSVSKPVKELAENSRLVARGIYDQQVSIDLEDEIGELGRSFNQMTNGLAERDRMHDMLGKVVSPAIAEELLKSKELVLGGEEKEATILFSDIRGFTTLCEGRQPSDILKILNQYLTRMNDTIEAHGGVVDKFIGDAIMAIFGTPIRHDDDPDRALRTALAMMAELERINSGLAETGFPALKIGIGINTDIVVAGNMGSRNRLNYTVLGDGVNLASRLESETKTYHQSIIISEATLKKAKRNYRTESLGEVQVKGKHESTRIYALLGEEFLT